MGGRRTWARWARWGGVLGGVVALGAVVSVLVGQRREAAQAEALTVALDEAASFAAGAHRVDLDALPPLPPPVERYLRHVLTDGQAVIRAATLQQSGVLRTTLASESWLRFTAHHRAVPAAPGFVWNARVSAPMGTHVRVLDSYRAGTGSGRVSLLSAFAVGSEAGVPELNSGALHRYLAEAVWYPTALIPGHLPGHDPGSGLEWSPVDEHRAVATLRDGGIAVSLEFRFNERGEVTGVYSEGRYGQFDGGYRQVPWEGRFRDYQLRDGMRIPLHGEVGWYDAAGELQLVWKGDVIHAAFEMAR